jgi:hypothetical protein
VTVSFSAPAATRSIDLLPLIVLDSSQRYWRWGPGTGAVKG